MDNCLPDAFPESSPASEQVGCTGRSDLALSADPPLARLGLDAQASNHIQSRGTCEKWKDRAVHFLSRPQRACIYF